MPTKYLFITGGVVSSLGKGLTSAAIAMLLEKKGSRVAMLKLDPYLNVDPGTMNPFQHGEVYVTDDGAETDLDLGHYWRYTSSPLSKASNATSGQIYNHVIRQERRGEYLGNTVQVIPHITDEIKRRILAATEAADDPDLVVVEIGGTAGDIESLPFFEAIRQFAQEHPGLCLFSHLTYVPYLKAAGEVKSKPTQHSVATLQRLGIFPDIIICRCEQPLPQDVKDKISLFCNVKKQAVIDEVDVANTIYELPAELHRQGLDNMIAESLDLPNKKIELKEWDTIVDHVINPKGTITIGIVGKYVQHQDAYKSVFEALDHGAIAAGYKIAFKRFEADKIVHNDKLDDEVLGCDGYLVPGGFGERGHLGKILCAKHCRENKVPYFGICLGMQTMVIEFARHVAGLENANSTEIDADTPHPIISLLSEQRGVKDLGGTMRLGAYPCTLTKDSLAHKAYGKGEISERHRHRYEFNSEYREELEKGGLRFTGTLKDGQLCEIAEVSNHPWMVGVQYHPEFKSKPTKPHPLFADFVKAMIHHKESK